MAATILVRKLDANGDVMRGNGLSNFAADIEAVAQIIRTRLLLFTGEWFENLADGTPMFQKILGVPTTIQAVALILRQRILGSPYVTGISSLSVDYVPGGRVFIFSATVETQFGSIAVTNS